MKTIATIIFCSFLFFLDCSAQGNVNNSSFSDIEYIDVIYLKNRSEFRGRIVNYTPEEITMELLGGQVAVFPDREIRKIVQERKDCQPVQIKQNKEYQFREKGIYNFTSGSTFNSQTQWGAFIAGVGINHVTGYQLNRFLGVGLGVGLENYHLSEFLTVVPIYTEVRGYLLKKPFTPFYSIGAGIGLPLTKDNRNMVGANPGIMVHPAVGYRLGDSKNVNFTIDIGFKYQKVSYDYDYGWERVTERHQFKRLAIRAGLLF